MAMEGNPEFEREVSQEHRPKVFELRQILKKYLKDLKKGKENPADLAFVLQHTFEAIPPHFRLIHLGNMFAIRDYELENPEITNYERFGGKILRNDTKLVFPEDSGISIFSFSTITKTDNRRDCLSSIAESLNSRPLGIYEALNIAEDMEVAEESLKDI